MVLEIQEYLEPPLLQFLHQGGTAAGKQLLADLEATQARLQALAPDFAGFRSAVCRGSRSAALDPSRLAGLVDAVRQPVVGAVV